MIILILGIIIGAGSMYWWNNNNKEKLLKSQREIDKAYRKEITELKIKLNQK